MKNVKLGQEVVWKMLFVILFDIIIQITNIGIDFQLYKK